MSPWARNEDYLLWEAALLSLALHLALFSARGLPFRFPEKHTVEIDITSAVRVGTPGAPRRAPAHAPAKPAPKPQAWVAPAPNQKVEPPPIPAQLVAAPPPEETPPPAGPSGTGGEYGIGTGEGGPNVLTRIPQILNLSDLSAILRRFYPEEARAQGKESTVVIDIHIDRDGRVSAVDVVRSGGSEFDAAALKVAKLLKFTPAFLGSERVAVKMRQAIQFKLEN